MVVSELVSGPIHGTRPRQRLSVSARSVCSTTPRQRNYSAPGARRRCTPTSLQVVVAIGMVVPGIVLGRRRVARFERRAESGWSGLGYVVDSGRVRCPTTQDAGDRIPQGLIDFRRIDEAGVVRSRVNKAGSAQQLRQ